MDQLVGRTDGWSSGTKPVMSPTCHLPQARRRSWQRRRPPSRPIASSIQSSCSLRIRHPRRLVGVPIARASGARRLLPASGRRKTLLLVAVRCWMTRSSVPRWSNNLTRQRAVAVEERLVTWFDRSPVDGATGAGAETSRPMIREPSLVVAADPGAATSRRSGDSCSAGTAGACYRQGRRPSWRGSNAAAHRGRLARPLSERRAHRRRPRRGGGGRQRPRRRIRARTDRAETPLHWAASSDDVAVLDALLDGGADIEATGAVFTGGTPMSDAVVFAQWRAARRLLERGATTTIWQAAALGLVDRVRELCAAEPPPARETITNAFWHACRGGQQATASYLLDRGADLNWVGHDRKTPLDVAQEGGVEGLANWLRSRRAE